MKLKEYGHLPKSYKDTVFVKLQNILGTFLSVKGNILSLTLKGKWLLKVLIVLISIINYSKL